jgi:hypothetical protein
MGRRPSWLWSEAFWRERVKAAVRTIQDAALRDQISAILRIRG